MEQSELALIRANLTVVQQAVADAITRVDAALAQAVKQPKPQPSVDEYVQQAVSATAIYKALEPELGVDRRTILTRVNRLVVAHRLDQRFPDWSTDVRLARYLAERMPDGRVRLVHATEALSK